MEHYKIEVKVFKLEDDKLMVDASASIPEDLDWERLNNIIKTGIMIAKVDAQVRECNPAESFQRVFHAVDAIERTRDDSIRLMDLKPEDEFDRKFRLEIKV